MISDKDFLSFINDKSIDLSKEELEKIIDTELEKPENIMDADLIEYCLDTLNEMNEAQADINVNVNEKVGDSNGNSIKHRFKKTAAIAAAAALLCAGIVSVSAFHHVDILNKIVEYYDDNVRIHFEKSENSADKYELLGSELAQELADNGISPVLLPASLLTDEFVITSITYEKPEGLTAANISYSCGKENGYIYITEYDMKESIQHIDYLDCGKPVKTIKEAGISVYIIEQNKKGTIAYQDNLTEYLVVTEMSFEDAIEFAKTIK